MAATTRNFINLAVRASAICQGQAPIDSSDIRFTGNVGEDLADVAFLFAKRFLLADLSDNGDGNYRIFLYDNGEPADNVVLNGDEITNLAGETIPTMQDFQFVYIRTSIRCEISAYLNLDPVAESILPTFLEAGSTFCVSIPEEQDLGFPPNGLRILINKAAADLMGAAFSLDLIVSARGA